MVWPRMNKIEGIVRAPTSEMSLMHQSIVCLLNGCLIRRQLDVGCKGVTGGGFFRIPSVASPKWTRLMLSPLLAAS